MGRFLGYLALAVLGVILAILSAMAHDKLKMSKRISLGAVGLVMVVGSGYAAIQVWMDQTSSPTPSVSPSPMTSSQPPASETAAPSPEVPSGETSTPPATEEPSVPPSESPAITLYYLSDVYPVATEKENRPGYCTGGCTGFRPGSARIGPNVYPKSYVMGNDGDGRRSVAVWNTARSCSRLEMTVGVDNSTVSRSQFTFTLSKDGKPPSVLATTGLAEPKNVTVDLEGVAQIQIAAYVSGPKAEGVSMVLGDAVLTCLPGSLDR